MATGLAPGSGLPDVNNGPRILGSIVTTTILALIAVSMRLYVRIWMLRTASFDDYFIIAAMTCSLISFGINIPDVMYYGAGRHAAYISPPSKIATGLKLNFITQPLLLAGVTFVKVSVGFFLLRIAPNNWYRRSIIGANTFLLGTTTFFAITPFVQCKPLAAAWDSSLRPTADCWDSSLLQKLIYINSSLNIVTDIGFALVPWPIIWNLSIAKHIKIALLAVLSLSIFACAASIVKITFISSFSLGNDFLWNSTGMTIWATTELNIGMLTASIPCLKPLLRVLREKTGHVPIDNALDVRGDSYFVQTTDTRNNPGYGDASKIEEGENGVDLQTLRKTKFTRTSRVYVGKISEEDLLRIHGPVIVKTIETEVHSEKEGSSVDADETGEFIKG